MGGEFVAAFRLQPLVKCRNFLSPPFCENSFDTLLLGMQKVVSTPKRGLEGLKRAGLRCNGTVWCRNSLFFYSYSLENGILSLKSGQKRSGKESGRTQGGEWQDPARFVQGLTEKSPGPIGVLSRRK